MSETKTAATKSPAKPSGLLGSVTTCLTTTFFIMVAAWCFLSAVEGWRSLHQHRVEASLNRIDALLTDSFVGITARLGQSGSGLLYTLAHLSDAK